VALLVVGAEKQMQKKVTMARKMKVMKMNRRRRRTMHVLGVLSPIESRGRALSWARCQQGRSPRRIPGGCQSR
jgi:hypothetical protein